MFVLLCTYYSFYFLKWNRFSYFSKLKTHFLAIIYPYNFLVKSTYNKSFYSIISLT